MPIEALKAMEMPLPFADCPKCKRPFVPFLRGQVARSPFKFLFFGRRNDIWALICWACKDIVGYEAIP